jgi:hypothetical protein
MKRIDKPVEVDVRVNPSCDLHHMGNRWGAGAELRLPFETAIQKAKEGVVTLLVSASETLKEAENGSAR